MITPTSTSTLFNQRSRQIRDQVLIILTNWGLLPRFKRWRLTQDPDTGMVVLFGILNNRYIAPHTSIPFSDYFDPRLLHDLAAELGVQIVACTGDGLRYAFVLDRGRFDKSPTHVDYPFIDNGKVLVRVVYGDKPQPVPVLPAEIPIADDQTLVRQGVGAFLKVFDDINRRDEAAHFHAQDLPDIVIIEEDEFKSRVAEQAAIRQRLKRMRNLFNSNEQENQT
jgi:hypothetical protein